jgi:hypothetical protein
MTAALDISQALASASIGLNAALRDKVKQCIEI